MQVGILIQTVQSKNQSKKTVQKKMNMPTPFDIPLKAVLSKMEINQKQMDFAIKFRFYYRVVLLNVNYFGK